MKSIYLVLLVMTYNKEIHHIKNIGLPVSRAQDAMKKATWCTSSHNADAKNKQ